MQITFDIPNIDQHPLRYSVLAESIERILFAREMMRNKDTGYVPGTLPTSIIIAEMVMDRLAGRRT